MKALIENGVHIPEDISLLGVGNYYSEEILRKRLTTFDPEFSLMGKTAARILMNEIAAKHKQNLPQQQRYNDKTAVINMTFIERETVKDLN